MQGAVEVGDQPATDHEGAVEGEGDAAEAVRADLPSARHGGDGVPRVAGEVEDEPLYLARAAVEGEGEEEGVAEAQSLPLSEEVLLVGEEEAPAEANGPAGGVGVDGEPQQAVECDVVGEARDERSSGFRWRRPETERRGGGG